MAVNQVSQAHSSHTDRASAPAPTRTPNGGSKAAATQSASHQAQANAAHATQAAAAAENNAGREQGNRRQPEGESKGTRVNVYA
jgi:hypothetical protein